MFVSGVQQTYQLYIYICYVWLFFCRFFSHIGYYRTFGRVPCALQWVLISHLWCAAAAAAAAAAKSLQSCLTLCNPIDGHLPGSPVPGILRARTLERVPFPPPMHESEKWKWSHSVVSDPQRPHGLQPIRLLRPWDFPGKSTGVGCHCLETILVGISARPLKAMKFYTSYTRFSVLVSSPKNSM